MLRAFNGESDAFIAKVSAHNAQSLVDRLTKTFDALNKLGDPVQCQIAAEFLQLRVAELELTYELAAKIQLEKEEQRRIKEQMREEEQANREFERVQREAEAEEARYEKALVKAKLDVENAVSGANDKLNAKVAELVALSSSSIDSAVSTSLSIVVAARWRIRRHSRSPLTPRCGVCTASKGCLKVTVGNRSSRYT